MRRALLFAATALVAACAGLLVDKGNAFPCDFSEPEGQRDLACSPGWVCGVANLCQPWADEGPLFTGAAPLPVFDAGLIYPGLMRSSVRAVMPDPLWMNRAAAQLSQGKTELWGVSALGEAERLADTSPDYEGGFLSGFAVTAWSADGSLFRQGLLTAKERAQIPGLVSGLRPSRSESLVVLRQGQTAAEPNSVLIPRYRDLAIPPDPANPLPDTATTDVAEARWLPHRYFGPTDAGLPGPEALVVATQRGFYWRTGRLPDAGDAWAQLNTDEELGLGAPLVFRHDPTATLWAVTGSRLKPGGGTFGTQLLSTWKLNRAAGGVPANVQRAWDDCLPCGLGRAITFTPVSLGGQSVEVLCEAFKGSGRSLVRVTGAQGAGACLSEAIDSPIVLADITRTAVDQTLGGAQLMGGASGALWSSTRLSDLMPLYLDRVPTSLGTMDLPDGRKRAPVAITDRYLAAPTVPNHFVAFRFQDYSDSAQGSGVLPMVAVGEANGWQIVSTGDVVRVRPRTDGGAAMEVSYGGRLVDGRGESAKPPFFAEAQLRADAGIAAVVLSADDSLYYYDNTLPLDEAPNLLPPITPQLTPEPNFPIRSMALDRSGVAQDGGVGAAVHGYLVTSRTLYDFRLEGQPARWTSRPLVLSAGEPVAVWMDDALSPRGRVGFRDGTVYTLPGGFPLVQSLPRVGGDGGTDRVLGYENFGGWPAALAESGLYVARWDSRPDGTLDNALPDGGPGKLMTWRPVTLPGGGAPWAGEAGTLKVFRTPRAVAADSQETLHELWLFGERGRVWYLGSLTRRMAVR